MQISYLVLAFALRTQYRFFATATSGIFELEEAKDDGDNRWYDLDLSKEEREALKIVFNVLFLAVACSTLFVPSSKSGTLPRVYLIDFMWVYCVPRHFCWGVCVSLAFGIRLILG